MKFIAILLFIIPSFVRGEFKTLESNIKIEADPLGFDFGTRHNTGSFWYASGLEIGIRYHHLIPFYGYQYASYEIHGTTGMKLKGDEQLLGIKISVIDHKLSSDFIRWKSLDFMNQALLSFRLLYAHSWGNNRMAVNDDDHRYTETLRYQVEMLGIEIQLQFPGRLFFALRELVSYLHYDKRPAANLNEKKFHRLHGLFRSAFLIGYTF